jgi:putative hydrolase of HD superfamily
MEIERVLKMAFEVGTLRKVARSHRQLLLSDDLSDNIASHSYRVTLIGYLLAKAEKVDPLKVLLMCLTHDVGETRSGDQNWVNKKYVKVFEDEILKDQFDGLVDDNEMYNFALEYDKRESLEAKIAKDADVLDQMLLLKEYSALGNTEAVEWLQGGEQAKLLFSDTAKAIAKKIVLEDHHNWWNDLWTAKRR